MPASRSVAAVALPSSSAVAGSPVAAISGGERRGAPDSRFTSPPSWSTMSSSGARTAAGWRIAWSRSAIARTCAVVPTLRAKSTTPATSPRRILAVSAAGTVRPAIGTTRCWPTS